MSIRRCLFSAVAATAILGASCASGDVNTIEPLRGHAGSAETTEPLGAAADGSVEAAVGGEATDAPNARDVRLEDLPDGMYEDAPPGFGEVPLDELDLPPDEPPPPERPRPTSPAPPTTPAPSPPTTRAPTPVPSGEISSITDYCTLFEQNDSIMLAVESALDSGRADQINAALQRAAQVHGRAAEIGPPGGSDHHDTVAEVLVDMDELLAQHGYDLGRLFAAAETDPALGARLAESSGPAAEEAMQRSIKQVLDSCGINLA